MRVLIIGGYGNFGSYIARALADDVAIQLLVGGRSEAKARSFCTDLAATHPAEAHAIDIDGDIPAALARIRPDIVIHTTGPFQTQDYRVACACVGQGCHYVDLADARDFVASIGTLDDFMVRANRTYSASSLGARVTSAARTLKLLAASFSPSM